MLRAPAVMRGARVAAAAVFGVLLVAGCGGGGETAAPKDVEPVPWSRVERALERRSGSYTKTTATRGGGETVVVSREWVAYDLARELLDRRIGLGDDPRTRAVEKLASRTAPSLRFIHRRDGAVMWNPGVRARCGTPWIAMPRESIEAATGTRVRDLVVVEPAEILRTRRGRPKLVESDGRATVYAVSVIGTAGIPYLSLGPDRAERLAAESTTARVVVPRRRGPIEMSVDVTRVAEQLSGRSADGGTLSVTWTLSPARWRIDVPRASAVRSFSCME